MRFGSLARTTFVAVSFFAALAACAAEPAQDEELGESESHLANANDHTAFLFFVGKGLTATQAAAVVGNLDQESGMNPAIKQAGGGPGRGIAQWSVGARWTQENAFAKQQGADPLALQTQLDFVWHELTTNARFGLAELQAATTLTAAVQAFEKKFEICGKCNEASRIQFAQAALDAFGGEAANVQPTDTTDPTTATDPATTDPATTTDPTTGTDPADPFDPFDPSTSTDPSDPAGSSGVGVGAACAAGGTDGICVATADCAGMGGTSTPNHCPGAANIQCCTF